MAFQENGKIAFRADLRSHASDSGTATPIALLVGQLPGEFTNQALADTRLPEKTLARFFNTHSDYVMPPYKQHLNTILEPLLRRLAIHAHQNGKSDVVKRIGEGQAGVLRCPAEPPEEKLPPSSDVPMENNWTELALEELSTFNRNGIEGICSVSEMMWKVQGIMNVWHGKKRAPYYFRGQHQFTWCLESSAFRNGITPSTNPLVVTQAELDALRDFQQKVRRDSELKNAVFPRMDIPHDEDSDWWGHMQHYASGTRLLDVTSSPLCGLWFACADRKGTVDDTVDGGFYLLPTAFPEDTEIDGPSPALGRTASTYFDVNQAPKQVRFRRMRSRNDRVLSQDGFFIWQPDFGQPYNVGQNFKFRVAASAKRRLLLELYRIGYTAERVLGGSEGASAEANLITELRKLT